MNIKSMVAAILMTLFPAVPGSAQSPADLLQKGIYAQETAGDLDNAIQIFRQVANPSSSNKNVAAQAQYQLVLCMLQRGDRPGAVKEVETLARNFPDQSDLVTKARKLLPGGSATLSVPWGENEGSQLNIKREGAATGEYLYYSVTPAPAVLNNQPTPNQDLLRWELVTKTSKRSALVRTDRSTGQALAQPVLSSNDRMGDPSVESLAGPAIDIQQSIFALRRLPLAVGYKSTLTTLPLSLSHLAPIDAAFTVTGIESVEVKGGKFKCYTVAFASLGQTFWIGMEGARPLVKFKAGNVEAELMKLWGPQNFVETELSFFRDAGWKFEPRIAQPGAQSSAVFRPNEGNGIYVTAEQIYLSRGGDSPGAS